MHHADRQTNLQFDFQWSQKRNSFKQKFENKNLNESQGQPKHIALLENTISEMTEKLN